MSNESEYSISLKNLVTKSSRSWCDVLMTYPIFASWFCESKCGNKMQFVLILLDSYGGYYGIFKLSILNSQTYVGRCSRVSYLHYCLKKRLVDEVLHSRSVNELYLNPSPPDRCLKFCIFRYAEYREHLAEHPHVLVRRAQHLAYRRRDRYTHICHLSIIKGVLVYLNSNLPFTQFRTKSVLQNHGREYHTRRDPSVAEFITITGYPRYPLRNSTSYISRIWSIQLGRGREYSV